MQTKKNSNIADILFVILLTGYSLMLVNQGMTLTDTGYNYGNFTNADSLDNMWKFSTYLANALGSFFTHLPLGRTLLGLNVYTGLVKAATAVMTYLFCVRSLNMRRGIVFASQLMALGYCWCPTALLYNYCTYFLFTLGAILLCLAVQSEKTGYYIGAGVCLGVNVLVRFPNLAEMTLIAALWTYCIIKKEKLSEGIKRTGWCVLGYLTGIAVMIGIIFLRYGPATYIEGIRQLFAMSAEAPSYSMKAMVMGSFLSYVQNLKWLGIMFLFAAVGIIVDYIIPETLLRVKRVLLLLLVFGMIVVFYLLGMYRFIYYAYPSIYTVGIVFLMVSGLLALAVLFFGKERYGIC